MLGAISLAGGDELVAAWEAAPEIASAQLEVFMHAATQFLEGEVKERTPGAHGTLKQSVSSEVSNLSDAVIGVVGSPLSYALPVEIGTRPHFPPVAAIEDWVKVKLGLGGPEAHGVAFAIARKIAKQGTKGAFMFRNALEASRAELERQLQLTVEAIKAQLLKGAS